MAVYSIAIKLFASFMPRHILKQAPNTLSVINKIVVTSPEAMVINSLVSGVFLRGKNKTPALVKNPFFHYKLLSEHNFM